MARHEHFMPLGLLDSQFATLQEPGPDEHPIIVDVRGGPSDIVAEILRRLLFSSVNEACKILEEHKAYRASDIDVMWLHGFGFPRYRGGLMFWADGIGSRAVYEQVRAWHERYGDRWAPSALLRELGEAGASFREAVGRKPI